MTYGWGIDLVFRRQLQIGFLLISLILVTACREVAQDDLSRIYVNDGLLFRQQVQLLEDGSYIHTVFQSSGNSVSTRENSWTFVRRGSASTVILSQFKPVKTYKDFAVHRTLGIRIDAAEITIKAGFFGTLVATLQSEPPVTFVSVDRD